MTVLVALQFDGCNRSNLLVADLVINTDRQGELAHPMGPCSDASSTV